MTIEGFWKKLSDYEVPDKRLPLRIYAKEFYESNSRFLRVGIDAYMWIFEALGNTGDSSFSGLTQEKIKVALKILESKIRYFISLNITFVIVFDGNEKVSKRRWNENKSNTQPLTSFFDYYQYYTQRNFLLEKSKGKTIGDAHIVKRFKLLLKVWNISYVEAPAEGEAELSRLNFCDVIDAVITNDADSFMYGAKVILKNFSKNYDDKPASFTIGQKYSDRSPNEFYVTPVRSDQLVKKMGLTRERIVFLACIAGSDVTSGVATLGTEKALLLAQSGSSTDHDDNCKIDFVKEICDIYVSTNTNDYLRGKVPHDYKFRINALTKLNEIMRKELESNTKSYFKMNYNCSNICLPPDEVFMSHFYPLLSPIVFVFQQWDTNYMDLNYIDQIKLCPLPQPNSVVNYQENDGEAKLSIRRGSSERPTLGFSKFAGQTFLANEFIGIKVTKDKEKGVNYDENGLDDYYYRNDVDDKQHKSYNDDSASFYNWFEYPDFEKIADYGLYIKNKSFHEFVVEAYSDSYILRAIFNLPKFTEDPHKTADFDPYRTIFIGRYKKLELGSKKEGDDKWAEPVYQVRFYGENIIGRFLPIEMGTDENMNIKLPTERYVWVPSYLLHSHENGIKLIKDYDATISEKELRKSPKKSPRRSTPRTKITPRTQKTTLDSLSKSPFRRSNQSSPSKSPITTVQDPAELGNVPTLDFGNSTKKRTVAQRSPFANSLLDQILSPKKSRQADSKNTLRRAKTITKDESKFIISSPRKGTASSPFSLDDNDDEDGEEDLEAFFNESAGPDVSRSLTESFMKIQEEEKHQENLKGAAEDDSEISIVCEGSFILGKKEKNNELPTSQITDDSLVWLSQPPSLKEK